MTEIQKTKIIAELERLEKEKDNIQNEIDSIRSDFASAWAIYGSELAGPSFGNLPDKLAELTYKTSCLKSYLENGRDPKKEQEFAESNIKRLGSEISVRSSDRNGFQKEAEHARYVLSVCGEQ